MYDVVVSEGFARWFEALEDAEAESVAALLGVVGELGPGLGAERARCALLWYDGCHGRERELGWGGDWQTRWRDAVESLDAFDGWRREALRCIESSAFSRLLAGLAGPQSLVVLQAVDQLRQRLRAARWALGSVLRESASGRAALGAELKATFESVMERVGLDPATVQPPSGGLREVTLRDLEPPARIIYGLDVTARRVVVLVADRLDHAYYGDSVRHAEASFRQYLAGREGIRPLSAARGA